jgi:hypothetical protein
MKPIFKTLVIILLSFIVLINGLYVYANYMERLRPCQADNLLVYEVSNNKTPALLREAQEDINLIMLGKEPKHSKHYSSAADGGSELYEAKDYQIVRWHSLATVENVRGYMLGYTLRLKNENDFPKEYSHSWFRAEEQRK